MKTKKKAAKKKSKWKGDAIDEVLSNLDTIATTWDPYEAGLPIHIRESKEYQAMRKTVSDGVVKIYGKFVSTLQDNHKDEWYGTDQGFGRDIGQWFKDYLKQINKNQK